MLIDMHKNRVFENMLRVCFLLWWLLVEYYCKFKKLVVNQDALWARPAEDTGTLRCPLFKT